MKHYLLILWLFFACATTTFAQNDKFKYVETPREIVLQAIAVQPDCPIKFEEVRYFSGLEGGGGSSYRLRNIGTKSIRSITVASTLGFINTYRVERGTLAKPGEILSEPVDCEHCKDDVIPLTNELREKLKLNDQMRTVNILMIVKVEFVDGTKYDDEKSYKALEVLFEKLDNAMRQYNQRNNSHP